jgi:O-antigen/teichoic acid export membrane protein
MLPQMSCLQGLLRLHAFNILQVLYPASFLLGLIAMDHFHGPLTPSSALVLLSTLSMLAGLCAAFLVVNCLRVRHPRIGTHSADRSIRKLFLGYSLGSYAANLLGSLNSRLPGLLAALTLAPTAAGVFAGLVILSDLFAFFSHAIASVTFPKLAGRSDPDGRLRDLQLACRINTTTTLAAIVIFGLMFDHVVSLILGSSYVGQQQFGWMSMVVLACSVPHSTARLLCTDFASQGSPQLNAWLNIPPMLLFISVFIVTAETWQTWGTVAAFASSTLLFSAFVFLAHQRRSGIVLRNIAILLPSDIRMVADRLRSPV